MGQWEEGSLPGSHMTECTQVPCLEWKIYDGSLRCLGVDASCHLDPSLHVVSHHPAGSPDVLRQWREQHRKAKPEAARPLETLTPHSCIFTSTVLYWPSKSQSQFTFKIQYRNKLLWGGAAKKCVAILYLPKFSSVQFSRSVVSYYLQPHGLKHARLPCPSPTLGACSNSCPSSQWCHPTISSSVIPFSSHLQTFPASGAFPMSQFFATGGQSIAVSTSVSVLPMNIQDWFPWGLTGWISLQSKGLSRVFSNTTIQKN